MSHQIFVGIGKQIAPLLSEEVFCRIFDQIYSHEQAPFVSSYYSL
ncbi:hypothetical protein FHS59_002530 [Algoriphagus iocasae]|uniref:Uncharacterized protein n=1 Tax=Algoriphagus iocasae TaxID=1836499 RepID=A0A841MFI0_9BACT|nr:hypothetical protein [Algoriphagus iocasae]